jgi:hypothetical protein
MKSKPTKAQRTIADAVYVAIHALHGASDKVVLQRASQLCGKTITPPQFKRAIRSFDFRGVPS